MQKCPSLYFFSLQLLLFQQNHTNYEKNILLEISPYCINYWTRAFSVFPYYNSKFWWHELLGGLSYISDLQQISQEILEVGGEVGGEAHLQESKLGEYTGKEVV